VYSYPEGIDLLQAQEPQQTYQEVNPTLTHTCRHRQKHEELTCAHTVEHIYRGNLYTTAP